MIKYPISGTGQSLILTETALDHMKRYRQSGHYSREAGGQLFARFENNTTKIEKATGPRPSDRRGFLAFVPNRFAERREIKQLFKEGLHYVGDWHTHPEPSPRPSKTDIDSFKEMFLKSHHDLESFIIIILGTTAPPCGLFVGLCDGAGCHELTPAKSTGTK